MELSHAVLGHHRSWGEHYWTGIWTSKPFAPNWILIPSLEMYMSNYKIGRKIPKPEDSGIHSYLGLLSEERNKCFLRLYKMKHKILSFCFFHLSLLELSYFPGVCELRKPVHLIGQLSRSPGAKTLRVVSHYLLKPAKLSPVRAVSRTHLGLWAFTPLQVIWLYLWKV